MKTLTLAMLIVALLLLTMVVLSFIYVNQLESSVMQSLEAERLQPIFIERPPINESNSTMKGGENNASEINSSGQG